VIISEAASAWPSLDLHAPELDRQQAVALTNQAHELCPYSRATRGNVEVVRTVGGVSIESAAA
jgi:organic hydroperoxide reductase OsmC/OhrA